MQGDSAVTSGARQGPQKLPLLTKNFVMDFEGYENA